MQAQCAIYAQNINKQNNHDQLMFNEDSIWNYLKNKTRAIQVV